MELGFVDRGVVDRSWSSFKRDNRNVLLRMGGYFGAYLLLGAIPLLLLTLLRAESVPGENVLAVAVPVCVIFLISRIARGLRLSWAKLRPTSFRVWLPALFTLESCVSGLVFQAAGLPHFARIAYAFAILGLTFAVASAALVAFLERMNREHTQHPSGKSLLRVQRFCKSLLEDLAPLEPPENFQAELTDFLKRHPDLSSDEYRRTNDREYV